MGRSFFVFRFIYKVRKLEKGIGNGEKGIVKSE